MPSYGDSRFLLQKDAALGGGGSGSTGGLYNVANAKYKDPLGQGGPAGLRDIVANYFLPYLKKQTGQGDQITSAFLDSVGKPGASFGEAQKAAEGYASELFAPGGQVAGLISRARGGSVQRGLDPSADAGGGERGILGQASNQVGSYFAQQAGALEGQRIGALTTGYQTQAQMINDLLQSIYTGVAGAEQLNLAKHPPRQKFLGIF